MLDDVGLVSRLVLAGVLLAGAVGKLTDLPATGEAVRAFGVPARHAPVVALLVPLSELLIAVLLVPAATARAAGGAALLMLAFFTAAVAISLRRGRRFPCRCFGRLGNADIGGWTVMRNTALMVLATMTAFASPPAILPAGRAPTGLVLPVLVAAASVALLILADVAQGRLSSHGTEPDASTRIEPLEGDLVVRGPAADFSLPTITGANAALHDLLSDGRPLLLAFLSPGCGPCKRLRPVIARWGGLFGDRLAVAVIATGTVGANRSSFGGSGVPVLVDADRAVAALYDVTGRPAAVLVAPDLTRLGPVARGEQEVRLLLGAALEHLGRRADPPSTSQALTLSSVVGPREGTSVTVDSSDDSGPGLLVVTDEVTGVCASLDPVAGLVWRCLDGRTPLEQIARDLAEAFGAPREVVADDVLRLVRHVGALGLLAGVVADRPGPTGATCSGPTAPPHPDPVPA